MHPCPQRNQSKWKSDFQAHGAEMIDWSKSYSLPFLYTGESKLQIFQFKQLHRRISTKISFQNWADIKRAVFFL